MYFKTKDIKEFKKYVEKLMTWGLQKNRMFSIESKMFDEFFTIYCHDFILEESKILYSFSEIENLDKCFKEKQIEKEKLRYLELKEKYQRSL